MGSGAGGVILRLWFCSGGLRSNLNEDNEEALKNTKRKCKGNIGSVYHVYPDADPIWIPGVNVV